MKKITAGLALLLLPLCMMDSRAGGVAYRVLRAGNVNDVIADMFIAARSRHPTQIRLAAGHYVFTRTFNSAYDVSLLPVIETTIEIIGSDPATTSFEASADVTSRLFIVAKGGSLSINRLTISGGNELCFAEPPDCDRQGGGAALNVGGELQFHNSLLMHNGTGQFEGLGIGGGGAILNLAGHLLLDHTTVTQNRAVNVGGGVALLGGKGTISDSTISGNTAEFTVFHGARSIGAGIYVGGGAQLNIWRSTISGNVSPLDDDGTRRVFGLGIFNSGTVTLVDSAVTENAPLSTEVPGAGGGIFNDGVMTIVNSTIGGNMAGTLGGGIYNSGRLSLQGVTITDNTAQGTNGLSPVSGFPDGCSIESPQLCVNGGGGFWNEPSGTIIAATSAIGANSLGIGDVQPDDCNGTLTSKGHNAIGNQADCKIVASIWLGGRATHDLVDLDLRLNALEDDGVPGNAHYAPLANSPLIDAGGARGSTCARFDQIGQPRVDGDHDHDGPYVCDIGAIEYVPPVKPAQN